jgi:AraC family transcriptional activator of tynA and feaB
MDAVVEFASGEAFPLLARQLFGNVRLEFADTASDRRSLRSAKLGDCRISELEAGPHSVFGDCVARASHDPDALKLLIQTKGASLIRQSGRVFEFGGGTPVFYDPTRPYALVNRTAVRLTMLQLPRNLFSPTIIARLSAPVVPGRDLAGLWHVLLATLRSSLAECGDIDPAGRARLGTLLVDIVRPLLEASIPDEKRPTASLDTLLIRCKSYIDAELQSPDLNVERIAARMGCSPRYVFRAFEAEGMTPAQHIRERRLSRARQALVSPACAGRDITEIAFSLGFSSSAHFSRAFRERFGQSPRDFRRAALA